MAGRTGIAHQAQPLSGLQDALRSHGRLEVKGRELSSKKQQQEVERDHLGLRQRSNWEMHVGAPHRTDPSGEIRRASESGEYLWPCAPHRIEDA
ncbi:hypothetical protein NDU88_006173 [Pleurodeles waltl]|uniref:Uncharacterized protein n=1 Tax=Pleurodeles waltl TaxID=8319 RepID=A0AAV7RNT1_PLEWA|nr:hypothetical protein NDU88_006173 [Pleurodeles waltl]